MLKLNNAPSHRWMSIESFLARVLRVWSCIRAVCHDEFESPYDEVVLIEFRSVMFEPRRIQELAQCTKNFVAIEVYMRLCTMFFSVLDPSSPLTIVDERCTDIMKRCESEQRPVGQLNEMTTSVRKKLLLACSVRFYDRYHPIKALKKSTQFYGQRARKKVTNYSSDDLKFSYGFDIQGVLHPRLADGSVIRRMINKMEVDDEDVPLNWTVKTLCASHFAGV